MIKSRVKLIESKRAIKYRPRGFFQVISSEKGLEKAKLRIETDRKKHPNCTIPCFRVILAGALNAPQQNRAKSEL